MAYGDDSSNEKLLQPNQQKPTKFRLKAKEKADDEAEEDLSDAGPSSETPELTKKILRYLSQKTPE